ncbi:DNA cytosine methyltransferase [Planctomycetaceae bacterium]|nr:DNA cytosine methyltransferase [Planctomycetaceae bacterium]
MTVANQISVIDLFAGPGGLGEGFSSHTSKSGKKQSFKIALSIEKDPLAHQTLELRAFFRQFTKDTVPDDYYDHLRNPENITRVELFKRHQKASKSARAEAWLTELGKESPGEIDKRIKSALKKKHQWALIGGPPCQAYSLVGRSRTGGIDPKDHRVFLYREYLRILAEHQPPVFVMENVKGILSSKVNGEKIFEKILEDLEDPCSAMRSGNKNPRGYRLFSLVKKPEGFTLEGKPIFAPHNFIIQCEKYGIPQARHRVIILGIRDDLDYREPEVLKEQETVTAGNVLKGLPKVRSGISKSDDSALLWKELLSNTTEQDWYKSLQNNDLDRLVKIIATESGNIPKPRADRGAEYIDTEISCNYRGLEWFIDHRLKGICNHSTRSHIQSDLYRYLFAACFAKAEKRSPTLKDFPDQLLPDHKNVQKGISSQHFADRFRVQMENQPSTTITSHIGKDGHYYIHYDPSQCRSLTVREAARLQTFPDNYFFCGPRTQQYFQVGNAVPPLLANQIAEIVLDVLNRSS